MPWNVERSVGFPEMAGKTASWAGLGYCLRGHRAPCLLGKDLWNAGMDACCLPSVLLLPLTPGPLSFGEIAGPLSSPSQNLILLVRNGLAVSPATTSSSKVGTWLSVSHSWPFAGLPLNKALRVSG